MLDQSERDLTAALASSGDRLFEDLATGGPATATTLTERPRRSSP
jgi:hypothetical protein